MPLPSGKLPTGRLRGHALYDLLRKAILDGTLRPGERLIEQDVASHLGVSRTPVREALHRLEAAELLRSSRDGVVVGSFTLDEFAEFCAVRETLEGMAARLAAAERSDLHSAGIKDCLESFRSAMSKKSVADMQRHSRAFHLTVARASRNKFLISLLQDIDARVDRLQPSTLTKTRRWSDVLDEHKAIFAAIESGDADDAERLARAHFNNITILRVNMLRQSAEGYAELLTLTDPTKG
jgi:DNA-binding GntR family transcriptional regulator